MHESERFAQIEAGAGLHHIDHQTTISLIIKDKTILPEGYAWEEIGREFSFKGKFYDIVSLVQTKDGWKLTAASDEAETIMVNNQKKANNLDKEFTTSKTSNSFKLKISQLLYDYVASVEAIVQLSSLKSVPGFYHNQIAHPYIGQVSPPPKTV